MYNTGNREGIKFFPGADIGIRLTDNLRLFGSWNTSYRMPTFTDLYYSVGGHLADPNLKSEKMNALELGIKFSGPGYRVVASYFANNGRDMIDWIKDTTAGEDAPWMSVNHTRIVSTGKEVLIQMDLPVLLNLPNFFLRRVSMGAQGMEASAKTLADNYRSMYALEYVRGKASVQTDITIWKRLGASLSYIYVDRATDSELIKPYHLLDAKLNYDARDIQAYIKFNNILGRPYYDFGEIPQPGLWIMGGVSMNLHFSRK